MSGGQDKLVMMACMLGACTCGWDTKMAAGVRREVCAEWISVCTHSIHLENNVYWEWLCIGTLFYTYSNPLAIELGQTAWTMAGYVFACSFELIKQ